MAQRESLRFLFFIFIMVKNFIATHRVQEETKINKKQLETSEKNLLNINRALPL